MKPKTIRDETYVHAGADILWALTCDVERWPEITATITAVEPLDGGPPRVGARYRITQPGQRPRVWTIRVMDAPTEFVWDTTIGPVTMAGGHRIEPAGDGCRHVLTIELGGRAGRSLGVVAGPVLRKALATENQGFKTEAEAVAQPGLRPDRPGT